MGKNGGKWEKKRDDFQLIAAGTVSLTVVKHNGSFGRQEIVSVKPIAI